MRKELIEKMHYLLKQGYDIISIGVILGVKIESLIIEVLDYIENWSEVEWIIIQYIVWQNILKNTIKNI